MNNTRVKYLVHARLKEKGTFPADFDDARAGRPIERRLNRIERVVTAYRGEIVERLSKDMHLVFETADAALLAACEMEHRCSVLPQLSGNWLALRIGIHQCFVQQRAQDGKDNAQEITTRLAIMDDGILASGIVVDALNPELKKLARPIEDSPVEFETYGINWRREIPAVAYGGESLWSASKNTAPTGVYLLLQHGLKTVEMNIKAPVLKIGRDPESDLALVDDHVSRHHCRIERRKGDTVLTDSSTNGTSVKPDQGEEILVRNESLTLKGKGLLFFGRPFNSDRRGGIRYEAF